MRLLPTLSALALAPVLSGLVLSAPALLAAQNGVDFRMGRWERAGAAPATTFEARWSYPLLERARHGLSLHVLVDDALGRQRSFYGMGWEVTAFRAHRGLALYPILGIAAGLSTDTVDQALAVLWSAGGGIEWRPVEVLALGAEMRYRVEDRGPHGFWNLEDSREGWSLAAGVSLHWRRKAGGTSAPREPPRAPTTITGSAAPVVQTALGAIGTPYTWGGTAANGYDCSGLVQWAYGQHGVALPRMSRDQARAGEPIPPEPIALVPGDVLLFAATPGGGVTHVGLYVGESTFIHSSSSGVKLSRLAPDDPEGKYWLPRWVGARRIIR